MKTISVQDGFLGFLIAVTLFYETFQTKSFYANGQMAIKLVFYSIFERAC